MVKLLSKENYNILSWGKKFPDNTPVNIRTLQLNVSWHDFINNLNPEIITTINNLLTKDKSKIYPYPDLLFNSLNLTPLHKIKVVILGQDPYHGYEGLNKKLIPQAMGLSFSVPIGFKIPSSLNSIYNNQLKFKHILDKPDHGNLVFWAHQGCLMLNTALTVKDKSPNSHSDEWKPFTDNLIKYISNILDHVVFVLWGNPALAKKNLIDESKHTVIVSSHPSGLSCHKSLGNYPAFNNQDHFKIINDDLKKHNQQPIIWKNYSSKIIK